MRLLSSLLIECADQTSVAAGEALAVDRELFASLVTQKIESRPNISIVREEILEIPEGLVIVASGPLTSAKLSKSIEQFMGADNLFFYDAIAPIVLSSSIDMDITFRSSRYGKGKLEEGDYINCPFTEKEYHSFVTALSSAKTFPLREFELDIPHGVRVGKGTFFEACLPIEELGGRGSEALAYGPLKPVGIIDPITRKRPYAVVQLRQEDNQQTAYNIVGFQTNLTNSEQERVFRMIPGLKHALFTRYGRMHRNTFINSPKLLQPTLQTKQRDDLFIAGQIIGVEGYCANIATGYMAGINAARCARGEQLLELPNGTLIGNLIKWITNKGQKNFQPVKANMGLLVGEGREELVKGKQNRRLNSSKRSLIKMKNFIDEISK